MKKKTLFLAVAIIFTWMLALGGCSQNPSTSSTTSTKQTTVIAVTGGNPAPFTYTGDDGRLTGQNIELLQAIFDRLPQYNLELQQTEFSSMFSGLTSERYQIGVNNLAKNAERKKNYLFSDPIFKNSYVAIFKKGNDLFENVSSWSDLAGLSTVGATGINTTTAIESYNAAHPDATITFNYTAEDLVAQLRSIESGKYDFLLMDKPMFEYYQKEYDFALEAKDVSGDLADELLGSPYSYLIFAKGQEELVEDVNAALRDVIEDGTSKKINEKYFGTDYSPSYKD